ncbi:MAG: class I SAM-dependent methyltransferase [Candidatus Neomarinimicrobiota bacterium]
MDNFLSFLYCPECEKQLEIKNEKLKCDKCEYLLIKNKNIWTSEDTLELGYKDWQKSDGTRLRERSKSKFSTSKFESIYYNKIIHNSLKYLKDNSIILELGAGDGRFTNMLQANHFVIVNDINFQSLLRYSNISTDNSRLLFICCSFEKLPIKKNSLDLITAIECLYYSNDKFEDIFRNLFKLLITNGLFLDSEPLIDGIIIYNLINKDFKGLSLNLDNNLKHEIIDKSAFPARVFSKTELKNIYNSNGAEIIIEKNIPLFFSILSIIMTKVKDKKTSLKISEMANNYKEEFSDYGRCYATLLKKTK